MGLDFTIGHEYRYDANAPRWSYGGFADFRRRLASMEGLVLDDMQGFGGAGSWAAVSSDLEPLLNHSDCDGEMTPEECRRVASRLREVLEGLPDNDYDRIAGMRLARYMELAAAAGEPLVFC